MKIRSSVKKICKKCRLIRRNKILINICNSIKRHKTKQG
ncbi:ribosomal protein L36 (apicoplast) [Babesia microti strain RI]|uniref:Ribosomal protein n=1 Tax=Babesia microti (strain RI) TaxID=1133968 RepID=A0A068W690_BABMR|nr:ribosomal protein L36 [Babesia microti strain RI]CDR32602.1 ribosomal protein L36 [Babesia microti strain RI]|eukprot:YP_009363171.1 ribosomal protein L36 (apicoplast) [Babesia microti strain RI]